MPHVRACARALWPIITDDYRRAQSSIDTTRHRPPRPASHRHINIKEKDADADMFTTYATHVARRCVCGCKYFCMYTSANRHRIAQAGVNAITFVQSVTPKLSDASSIRCHLERGHIGICEVTRTLRVQSAKIITRCMQLPFTTVIYRKFKRMPAACR